MTFTYIFLLIIGTVFALFAAGLLWQVTKGPVAMYDSARQKYQGMIRGQIERTVGIWYVFLLLTCVSGDGLSWGVLGINKWLSFVLIAVIPYTGAFFYAWGRYLGHESEERFVPTPTLRQRAIKYEKENGPKTELDRAIQRAGNAIDKARNEGDRQAREDKRRAETLQKPPF